MHIKFIEIANFRKLLSIRVDLAESTTVFVGANNSGKTSAMVALRKFLSQRGVAFETYDITLSNWATINQIGQSWIDAKTTGSTVSFNAADWVSIVPTLDLWFHVEASEFHYVHDLIPTLDWEGGELGVRLRFEPKDLTDLYKDFLEAADAAKALKTAADQESKNGKSEEKSEKTQQLTVWPSNLVDFLARRLTQHFEIRAYVLDPARVQSPEKSQAKLQLLPTDAIALEGDPLQGLIRVNEIPAQRGFVDGHQADGKDGQSTRAGSGRLSEQLRAYYSKHLDPTDCPDPRDLGALQAIEAAQAAFDARLTESFKEAFSEVEEMGYPGVTDPRPRVSTRLKATDGLNHSAAITFEVDVVENGGSPKPILRLPEDNNGLGYQNLISMIFRLMSFRDGWMRVGKASKAPGAPHIEPLHLVLVEEPEAHLHAQVQQVFIKKAYDVLREHDSLGTNNELRTQLIVSTHSSHVAHETAFECLRYFRRLPAGMVAPIPVSAVVNLSKTFGSAKDTEQFVTRYLHAQHADLFFADAAILVEGPAERMLIPNFIRSRYPFLNQCYISLLEIGGSHAHRLRPLIEELSLLTLIITDLDALDRTGGKSVQPVPNKGQVTNNATLKDWIPKLQGIDELSAAKPDQTINEHDALFQIRVAYQMPIKVTVPASQQVEDAYPYTFEDAFAFENLALFSNLDGFGLVRKFRDAINEEKTAAAIGTRIFEALKTGKKAEFALDIIDAAMFETLAPPTYITEGLKWLEGQLKKKQVEILPTDDEANT